MLNTSRLLETHSLKTTHVIDGYRWHHQPKHIQMLARWRLSDTKWNCSPVLRQRLRPSMKSICLHSPDSWNSGNASHASAVCSWASNVHCNNPNKCCLSGTHWPEQLWMLGQQLCGDPLSIKNVQRRRQSSRTEKEQQQQQKSKTPLSGKECSVLLGDILKGFESFHDPLNNLEGKKPQLSSFLGRILGTFWR